MEFPILCANDFFLFFHLCTPLQATKFVLECMRDSDLIGLMVFYVPLKFFYIKAVTSGMVEETEVPGQNHGPLASELTNFITLGSAPVGFKPSR